MSLRSALAVVAAATLAAPAFAAAPSNGFNLVTPAGKTIGNASYTISKDKNGYHVVGKFQYRQSGSSITSADAAPGMDSRAVAYNEGQFSEDFKISETGQFLSGYTQNSSTQMMTSFQPAKAGNVVTINQLQAGASNAHDVPLPKPVFLVVPDFDPAMLQIFLTTALAHPHDDKTYLFLVPAGANPRGRDQPEYVVMQLAPDSPTGTLDGKPVTLKHYVVGYHTGDPTDLYADSDGNLMQANVTPLHVNYIRAKFTLTQAAK